MSSASPPPEEVSARDRIVAAAIRHVARHGVRGIRVEQVAKDAAVSVPLLYYHFPNREALVRKTLDSAVNATPRDGSDGPGSRKQSGVQAVGNYLLADVKDDAEARMVGTLRSEALAAAVFDDTTAESVRGSTDRWRDEVASLIRQAMDDGSADPSVDADLVARELIAMVDGVRERWLADVIDLETARTSVARATELLVAAGA